MKITAWFAAMLAQGDAPPAPVDEAKPPVVLVHGIHSSAADMVRLAQALRAVGRETHVIDLKPANGSAALEQLCSQLEDFIHSEIGQRRLDLVGYSMGGIISRYYVQKRRGHQQVRRFLCLSAPNHGTVLGWLNSGAGGRQMRLGSSFLTELNSDTSALAAMEFRSLWTRTDVVILPARSSVLPGLPAEHLWGLGHASWIFQRSFISRVVELLEADSI